MGATSLHVSDDEAKRLAIHAALQQVHMDTFGEIVDALNKHPTDQVLVEVVKNIRDVLVNHTGKEFSKHLADQHTIAIVSAEYDQSMKQVVDSLDDILEQVARRG